MDSHEDEHGQHVPRAHQPTILTDRRTLVEQHRPCIRHGCEGMMVSSIDDGPLVHWLCGTCRLVIHT